MTNAGKVLGSIQLALSVIAPSLLPWIGIEGVVVVLAVSNAAGGVAHIWGYSAPPSAPPSP